MLFLDEDVQTIVSICDRDSVIDVTVSFAKVWDKNPEDIYNKALDNVIKSTRVGVSEHACEITNANDLCGASILLAPVEIRKIIKPVFGDCDMVIAPTSTHELILYACDGSQVDELIKRPHMCRINNKTLLATQDILGWNAILLHGDELIPATNVL